MIQPRIRTGITWEALDRLMADLQSASPATAAVVRSRIDAGDIDGALTDPSMQEILLSASHLAVLRLPLPLHLFLAVDQALREAGVEDVELTDYIATLVLSFGDLAKATGLGENEPVRSRYLTDLLAEAADASDARAATIRVHIAEVSLWLAGVWHEWIRSRANHRGGPNLGYYDSMGTAYYAHAAGSIDALDTGMSGVYASVHRAYPRIRVGLNAFADQHLFPTSGMSRSPESAVRLSVERLLRATLERSHGHA